MAEPYWFEYIYPLRKSNSFNRYRFKVIHPMGKRCLNLQLLSYIILAFIALSTPSSPVFAVVFFIIFLLNIALIFYILAAKVKAHPND